MSLKIRRNSYLWHASGNFFVLCFFALSFVNFEVCSIDFVLYLLNGVIFSIFVLIRDYCTLLSFDGFPTAATLLSLSFEFVTFIDSKTAKSLFSLLAKCTLVNIANKVFQKRKKLTNFQSGLYCTRVKLDVSLWNNEF